MQHAEATVIPWLLDSHKAQRKSTGRIWHAEPESGDALVRALFALNGDAAGGFVDSLLEQGASFNALCQEVFEPAQRLLGRLWDEERCDDFQLSIGMARLHVEMRRVNAAVPGEHAPKPSHRVLLCSQPGEAHRLGLLMSMEAFERGGWEVTCEFPDRDQFLLDLVNSRWFDVLKLSQSGALLRDTRLVSMRSTIDAARAASRNPAIVVMVDGRTFAERPNAYQAVHANAAACSVLDSVLVAERLLTASRSANVAVSLA